MEFHAAEEPDDFYIDVRGLVGTVPHCIELSDDDGDGGGDGGGDDERSMKSWAQVSWEMVKLLRWTHHSRWTPVFQVQHVVRMPAATILQVATNSRHSTKHTRYFDVLERDTPEECLVLAYPKVVISSLNFKNDKSHLREKKKNILDLRLQLQQLN